MREIDDGIFLSSSSKGKIKIFNIDLDEYIPAHFQLQIKFEADSVLECIRPNQYWGQK